jgi:RHS repeat-associated protein
VVGYQYDAAGNRTRITYPDTKTVDYAYDDANRLSSVTDWLTKVTSYAYDDAGRLITTSFPTGVSEARTYNNADQLASIIGTKTPNTLTSFTYTLDDAGLRTAVVDLSGTESYTYDNLYRLTGVAYSDTTTQAYTYDAVGNRLTKVQGSTTSYTYDDADRMTAAGGVTYSYSANGNLTGRGSDTFGWDLENRLTSATVGGTSATFAYRGDNLRESRTVGGTTTTYSWDVNSSLPVVLQDGTYSYVYGHGLISQTDGSGTQTYALSDGIGSTRALTDGSGTVTATYDYDVFGALRASTGTASTDYRFTGQQDDPTLGMQYLRARYYDPSVARFVSKDPFIQGGPGTQGLNQYTYVADGPINDDDPTGMCWGRLAGICQSAGRMGQSAISSTKSLWSSLRSGQPGEWVNAAESMSARASAYQTKITGRLAGEVYRVNGVKFDGFRRSSTRGKGTWILTILPRR